MAQQSLDNTNNKHLLFKNLNNNEFESLNNTNMQAESYPIDMDRLSQLRFTIILNLIHLSIQTKYSVIITYQRISTNE